MKKSNLRLLLTATLALVLTIPSAAFAEKTNQTNLASAKPAIPDYQDVSVHDPSIVRMEILTMFSAHILKQRNQMI